MYDVVSLFFQIYYAVFCGYCLQYFCGSFLEYRRQERRWNGLYVAVSYAILGQCVNLSSFSGDIKTIGSLVLDFLISTALALCFYKAVKAITGYLVITFMAVTQISFYIAHSIYELAAGLNNLWVWCVEKGYIVNVVLLEIIMGATVIGLQVLMFGIFSILCYRSTVM